MMDAETLSILKDLTGPGVPAPGNPPANLIETEQKAYAVIAKENCRLEQEKIPQQRVLRAFKCGAGLKGAANTAGLT